MPYSGINDSKLPSYVKKLPDSARSKWVAIFNEVYNREGEELAFIVANNWLKKHVKKQSVEANTSQAVVIEKVSFDLSGEQLVKLSEAGEEYIDFVLADTGIIRNGDQYPEALLMKWLEQINNGLFVGDIDHEEYDKILSSTASAEQAAELIKNTKKGIAKSLRAIYEKGKLWVRAIIDKRYKRLIENAKGVSLEAIISRDANNKVVDGDLLGFTFAVKDDPVNPRAVIA